MDINGIGALYTVKLALHYFHRQFAADQGSSKDQVLVLQASLAGYLDLKGAIQYAFTKYGLRGAMKSLRHTEPSFGVRVNLIAPWYVILSSRHAVPETTQVHQHGHPRRRRRSSGEARC
jgi:NAD(P)-dependent dehydrogenase (short-subunit alcohol dehydrogenase family)